MSNGDVGDLRAILIREWRDQVVEAVHQNMPIGAAQRVENHHQRVDRVLHRAAIHARMQIAIRAAHVDLHAAAAAQADQNCRLGLAPLPAIRAEREIAGQQLAVRSYEIGDLRAADLLLAFEEEFDIHRQRARALQQRLDRQDRREHIALVVGGAARI